MTPAIKQRIFFFCFAILSLISLLVVQLRSFADDPGVGWHIATGQWIVNHKSLPFYDPFLASAEPRVWVSDQWASDIVLYGLYRLGSWPLLYCVLCLTYFLTFWLLLPIKLQKNATSLVAIALTCLLASKLAQVHFILRPVLFSFPFLVLARALVESMERATGSADLMVGHTKANQEERRETLSVGAPSVLQLMTYSFLLFMFWSWFHASFPLGLALLGCALLGNVVDLLRAKSSRKLALVSAACLAAACLGTLVNPYGIRLHASILELTGNKYFMHLHEEWLPPELLSPEGQSLLLSFVVFAIAVLLKRKVFKELPAREFVTMILFGYLACTSRRLMPVWAIVSAWPLLISIEIILNKLRERSKVLRNLIGAKSSVPVRSVTILAFLVFGFYLAVNQLPFYSGPFGPRADKFPYKTLESLKSKVEGAPIVIGASPDWGGFITFFGEGRLKPVIDDRNTLIGEHFYRRFDERMKPEVGVGPYIKELGINYVLLSSRSKLAEYLLAQGLAKQVVRDDVGWALEITNP